jgi:hypothetical protein
MEITVELLDALTFLPFLKVAPISARQLTERDYENFKGSIQTLEGLQTFQPSDYLALGVKNEMWPMSKYTFEHRYYKVQDSDSEGFARYQRKNGVLYACQITDVFVVKRQNGDVYHGKAGDYLVKSENDNLHIVDCTIFEASYKPINSNV